MYTVFVQINEHQSQYRPVAYPANTKHAGLMLANIRPALGQCVVFADNRSVKAECKLGTATSAQKHIAIFCNNQESSEKNVDSPIMYKR